MIGIFMKKLDSQPLSSYEHHTAQSKPNKLFNECGRKKGHIRAGMLKCNKTDPNKEYNRKYNTPTDFYFIWGLN